MNNITTNEAQKELFGDTFPLIEEDECECCKLDYEKPLKISDYIHQIRDKYDPTKQ